VRHPTTSRGFTLIELLVSIAIIAILIGLLIPALSGARTTARQTAALANQRSVAISFSQYADQYKSYPFRKKGEAPDGLPVPPDPQVMFVKWWPEGVLIGTSEHWHHAWIWPGIVSAFSAWPEKYKMWVSPGMTTELPDFSFGGGDPTRLENVVSLRYSNSFVARPALFKPGAAADNALIASTQPHEVTFPSSKVMLWDAHLAYIRKTPRIEDGQYAHATPMAFADQHAEAKDPTKATRPVGNPLKNSAPVTLHDTPDGIAGRDY